MLEKLKEHKELIPIYSIGLYAIGFVFYISFYDVFDINIAPYLSLTEVLINTIKYSLVIASSLFIVEVLFIFLIFLGNKILKKEYVRYQYYLTISGISLILVFLLIAATVFLNCSSVWLLFFLVLLLINTHLWIITTKADKKSKTELYLSLIIFLVGIIFVGVVCFARDLGKEMRNGAQFQSTEIRLNDGTKYSTLNNDTLFFIGYTNSTVFLYNKTEKKTIILNNGSISDFNIYYNKKWNW